MPTPFTTEVKKYSLLKKLNHENKTTLFVLRFVAAHSNATTIAGTVLAINR